MKGSEKDKRDFCVHDFYLITTPVLVLLSHSIP